MPEAAKQTTMNRLIVTLPYCSKDHAHALRLLKWMQELDGHLEHSLLLVADDAVPMENKKAMDAFGKSLFSHCETIPLKCPAPVGDNYHVPAAFMFLKAMGHIDSCYKHNWIWLEPDAVPLRAGWLDTLALAYDECPKRFLGSTAEQQQEGVPSKVFFATALYPNCAYEELKPFCDGKTQAFDMAFSEYVLPRAQSSHLFHHRFGAPNDPPTFKETKLPTDGVNVGTLDMIPKEAVLFHRNKDGSLIELLNKQRHNPILFSNDEGTVVFNQNESPINPEMPKHIQESGGTISFPAKRRPGRPPKQPALAQTP